MKRNLEKIEIRIPPQRFAQEPANIEKGIYDVLQRTKSKSKKMKTLATKILVFSNWQPNEN